MLVRDQISDAEVGPMPLTIPFALAFALRFGKSALADGAPAIHPIAAMVQVAQLRLRTQVSLTRMVSAL
jgi:hypothetical protein